MSTITGLRARRVWDSRARPTVEVEVACGSTVGRAIAPAGASTGSGEAVDLRDGGTRLGGFDVTTAVANVNRLIAPVVVGLDAADQEAVDSALVALDATPDCSRLGANAMVATSMAAASAGAAAARLPLWAFLDGAATVLPMPEIQVFGGGAHAGRRLDLQDLMVVPIGATSFAEALDAVAEVHHAAGRLMASAGLIAGGADEGGWWPAFRSNEEGIGRLVDAIEQAGLRPGVDMALSIDVAATQFGRGGRYRLSRDERDLSSEEWRAVLSRWLADYPIVSIEDPVAEDDHDGMAAFTAAHGHAVQIVGDDYLVTDAARIEAASARRAANAVLIKPNQCGTLTGARRAVAAASAVGYDRIVSARSGESEDVTIVHLAVGWRVGQLKVGSMARGERTAKWNECLRIEEALGAKAELAPFPRRPS